MPVAYRLELGQDQERELREVRDHARKPYLRERAAVLLAVAHGASLRAAARSAGLKPHHVDTVCEWRDRYLREGLAGWTIRKGRGRKPASFPDSARRGGRAGRPPRPTTP